MSILQRDGDVACFQNVIWILVSIPNQFIDITMLVVSSVQSKKQVDSILNSSGAYLLMINSTSPLEDKRQEAIVTNYNISFFLHNVYEE
jgi:hypothetical protein